MKKALTTGLLVVLPIGILVFLFKWVMIDFLAVLFRPLILLLFGKEYLVIPLTIVFTVLIIFLVGFLFSWVDIGKLFRRIPKNIQGMPGALVELGSETYFIAAIIKKVKLKKDRGETTILYVLYGPSAPIPWSGLPIIFAKEEKVIPLKISFGEVYGITTSFGRTTPELLEELKTLGAD
jgi:uncharacterized membrane protein